VTLKETQESLADAEVSARKHSQQCMYKGL